MDGTDAAAMPPSAGPGTAAERRAQGVPTMTGAKTLAPAPVGQTVTAWLLLLPALVLLVAFTHWPAVATVWHSVMTTPKKSRPSRFAGLDNYRAMADDEVFWQALWNNLGF